MKAIKQQVTKGSVLYNLLQNPGSPNGTFSAKTVQTMANLYKAQNKRCAKVKADGEDEFYLYVSVTSAQSVNQAIELDEKQKKEMDAKPEETKELSDVKAEEPVKKSTEDSELADYYQNLRAKYSEEEIEEMEALSTQKVETDELQRTIEEAISEITELQKVNAVLKGNITRLKKASEVNSNALKESKAFLASEKKKAANLDKKLKASEKKLKASEKKLKASEKKITDLEKKLKAKK